MTFFVESLGCAKNQVDSEELIAHLERGGLTSAAQAEEADLIIVNTCGFITSAKEESIQTSLDFKDRFPGKRVLMTGCLVQRYSEELAQAMQEIDGFAPLRDFEGILRLARGEAAPDGPAASGAVPALRPSAGPSARSRLLSFPGSAYVKVADGCGNRCSYCAIPLIRGELESRPPQQVVEEIRGLLDRGVYELVLIAQDLASYGRDLDGHPNGATLLSLLESICRLPGPFWLRLLYLHPDHFPTPLLDLAASEPRLLPYFDLPFQHASRAVLSLMGRRGSSDSYLELVGRIRGRLPQAALRSTFLVGFPGEGDEDFGALAEFQKAASLDWLGVFAYSREEGTRAYDLPGRVPASVAEERKRLLEQAQLPITEARLEAHVGRELEVLVEEEVHGEDRPLALARSYLQAPEVDGLMVVKGRPGSRGELRPGARLRVRVERRAGVDLEACLAAPL